MVCPKSQPLFPQLSLTDSLPTQGFPGEHALVVLKCYFDAGNKADSAQYDVVTLATVSAIDHYWRPFESAWAQVLRRHGASFLHTTDAVTGNDIYDGWTVEARHALLRDCVQVAGDHIAVAISVANRGRFGILPFTVSINLKDYIAAKKINERLPATADEGLIRQAVGACLVWGETRANTPFYHFFFDQNEPFYGYIYNMKHNKKARRDSPILDRIIQTAELNMRHYPALQLADLYAWSVSHKRKLPLHDWQEALLNMDRTDEWYEGDKLNDIYEGADRWKTWNIPRRRPTT
jgi:hypothetical protein